MSELNQSIVQKWKPILEHESFDAIEDNHKKNVVAAILENTELATRETGYVPMSSLTETTNVTGFTSADDPAGPTAGYDPVLIKLVRRTMPNLMAYDIAGVQPMKGPTGLIFAMRSMKTDIGGAGGAANNANWSETFYNEPDSAYSGTGTQSDTTGSNHTAPNGVGVPTATAELYGTDGGTAYEEMAMSLEKVTVSVESRLLKAQYTTEMAQDLKSVHGLDAETELSNMLATEIVADMNREVVRTVYNTAVTGAQDDVATPGTFDLDVDANGRWSAEKFKGLLFQVDREANAIAKGTRRDRGNIIICSSDVASALSHAGILDYAPALKTSGLNINDTGSTFAGVLSGKYRVYIDPYAGNNYMVVGYKGQSAFDAGLFYCPYVPLQMMKAIGEDSFQPRIGFKTRYGLVANPFAEGPNAGLGRILNNSNQYYRRVLIRNIM